MQLSDIFSIIKKKIVNLNKKDQEAEWWLTDDIDSALLDSYKFLSRISNFCDFLKRERNPLEIIHFDSTPDLHYFDLQLAKLQRLIDDLEDSIYSHSKLVASLSKVFSNHLESIKASRKRPKLITNLEPNFNTYDFPTPKFF